MGSCRCGFTNSQICRERDESLASRSGRITCWEVVCGMYHWIRGSVDSRAILDAVAKRKILASVGNRNPLV
jgi:hypothetical protein